MLYSGSATVTSSGSKVPLLSAPTKADWITIYPGTSNSGTIYVGGSNVSASSDIGAPIGAGDAFVCWPFGNSHGAYDLSLIYVDSTSSGDKVKFVYGRN